MAIQISGQQQLSKGNSGFLPGGSRENSQASSHQKGSSTGLKSKNTASGSLIGDSSKRRMDSAHLSEKGSEKPATKVDDTIV